MSWIERSLEKRLADAAANGELDIAEPLKGKPIPGIDSQRTDGWWANQFVERELSHDRRVVAESAAKTARAGFWRCATVDELHAAVSSANLAIRKANINLIATDQLALFDRDDIVARWHALR